MKISSIRQALSSLAEVKAEEADYPTRGFHLDVSVPPPQITAAAAILNREGFFIEAITGVDWLGEREAKAKEAAKAAAAAAKKAAAAAAKTAEEGESPAVDPQTESTALAPSGDNPEAEEKIEQNSASDEAAEDSFEVVYDFNCYSELCRVTLRTRVPRSSPEVPTISDIYQGANWHERETHDFFGIIFSGHPDLSPLLLPEDADFHPLRKDYQP